MLVCPALVIGVLNVLVPLIASDHDGTSLVTTVAFLGAAVIGGLFSPLVGQISDRFGPSRVIRIGMVVSAVTALGFAVTTNLVLLAVLTVVYLGIANVLSSVPAVAAASSIGSRGGLASVGAAIAIIFAVFETAGAVIAVPSQDLFGEVLPFVGLAVVASLSLVLVSRLRVVQPASSTAPTPPVLQSPKP